MSKIQPNSVSSLSFSVMVTDLLTPNELRRLEKLQTRITAKRKVREKRLQAEHLTTIKNLEKKEDKPEPVDNVPRKTYKQAAMSRIGQNESEVGRKLFVGKLKFIDLRGKESLLYTRQEIVKSILKSFGEVEEFRCFWAREFLFVLYCDQSSANRALSATNSFSKRESLIREFGNNDKLSNPKPNFYVRLPST